MRWNKLFFGENKGVLKLCLKIRKNFKTQYFSKWFSRSCRAENTDHFLYKDLFSDTSRLASRAILVKNTTSGVDASRICGRRRVKEEILTRRILKNLPIDFGTSSYRKAKIESVNQARRSCLNLNRPRQKRRAVPIALILNPGYLEL